MQYSLYYERKNNYCYSLKDVEVDQNSLWNQGISVLPIFPIMVRGNEKNKK